MDDRQIYDGVVATKGLTFGPFQYKVLDSEGNPTDLSVAEEVFVKAKLKNGVIVLDLNGRIIDAQNGIIGLGWSAEETAAILDVGEYTATVVIRYGDRYGYAPNTKALRILVEHGPLK